MDPPRITSQFCALPNHEFLGTFAAGVKSADQSTHAGAGDIVDGNMMFLKPLQDAYMCQSQRSATSRAPRQWLAGASATSAALESRCLLLNLVGQPVEAAAAQMKLLSTETRRKEERANYCA